MKKLVKIRLINWHYLSNETIEINGNTLLTGPNASGKSTIMDAITYVLTAGDTVFNLAANDKGKRDLRGYVKCKLGMDDKEYLRNGDVSGHIALQFHDEKTDTDFSKRIPHAAANDRLQEGSNERSDSRATDAGSDRRPRWWPLDGSQAPATFRDQANPYSPHRHPAAWPRGCKCA